MATDAPEVSPDLAANAPTPLVAVRDGTVVAANDAARRLFDHDEGALAGLPFVDLVAEHDRDRVEASLSAVDDSACPIDFELPGEAHPSRVVESTWEVLETDDGRVLVGHLHEVTEERRRRRELERESEMLGSLLDNIPMSIYFKDRQSRHERVSTHMLCSDPDSYITNQEGKRHAHPEDILGKTDFDLYDPEFAAAAIEEDEAIMDEAETMFNEVTESVTNLGEPIFTSTTKAPRYDDDGNVIGLVGVTMDVTDRKLYERELERQNERLEQFAEVLSHDLRSPLSVANGRVELMQAEYEDANLDAVERSLDRMGTLIGEIRSFVIEGRTVESPEAVDIDAAAREAWASVEAADATLAVEATHTISADRRRLQRLLENLFRNAVEHGRSEASDEDGSITVTVGDLETGFYVADDGDGIPDDQKETVFDRGVSSAAEGTGFGLAIVRNIAEAHDWAVAVADAESGGARFEFPDVVRVEPDADTHG